MYYEEIYQIEDSEELENLFFKIKRIKPTKLFSYQTLLGQVFGDDSKKTNDEVTLQKCYDFILENVMFAREKDGHYKEVQFPGIDNTNLKEIDENPNLIGPIIAMFINKVTNPIEKK